MLKLIGVGISVDVFEVDLSNRTGSLSEIEGMHNVVGATHGATWLAERSLKLFNFFRRQELGLAMTFANWQGPNRDE